MNGNNQRGLIFNIMARIFGANWTTTLSGYLTLMFAAIYTQPELIHWVPEPEQGIIWNISKYLAGAGFLTLVHQTKSKNVTGGNIQQTLDGSLAPATKQPLVDATKSATESKP